MSDTAPESNLSGPETYEAFFVPGVFGPWADRLLSRAAVRNGERILDLGCGTGIVARKAAAMTGSTGSVTGLDMNPGMLAVAAIQPVEANTAPITWVQGSAGNLEFGDGSFDLVTIQQVLQFVPDRIAVLLEVNRVLVAGGRVAIGCWAGPELHPLHGEIDEVIARHIGQPALIAGFGLSEPGEIRAIIEQAGLKVRSLEFLSRNSRFPDPASAARNYILSSSAGIPSFRQLDVAERDRLLELISTDMADLVQRNTVAGEFIVPWHAHIAIAEKV